MDKSRALKIYWRMLRIRLVEEALADEYQHQEMKCPMHLYIGQEAIAAGVSEALATDDALISTHRSHGHYLAKAGAMRPFFAELYGRETGSSKGKGGSMHLFDLNIGYYGSSAIVGGNIPMVAGLALAFKTRQENKIAVAYLGDGAEESGVLYETLNFAALKKLPMLFVCENNQYAVCTPFAERQQQNNIYKRAETFGLPSYRVDGNDAEAVFAIAEQSCTNIRAGNGPVFIEADTYRWRTHCGPQWDVPEARPQQELEKWLARCPIKSFEKELKNKWLVGEEELTALRQGILAEIADAFAFAKGSVYPPPSALWEGVLA